MSGSGAVDSADGTARAASPSTWKVTLPCTRVEAEAIDDLVDLPLEPMPTLMTSEAVLDDPEAWRLEAYFQGEPSEDALAIVAALAPSATVAPMVEQLPDEDWVTMSQAGLAPLHVGRFFVHAGDETPPPDTRAFRIAAGRAFGTGHHETTSGCLQMLDGMAGRQFARIVDIGTGTGLLAFAAAHLWPEAAIVATDIDAVAIEVTRENAAANGIEGIDLVVADGALDDRVTASAPYDLVIANILAGPLVSMAPELAAIAAPGATVVLAGLLETQRDAVVGAYADCGCTLEAVDRRGDWSVLRLSAGKERYVPAGPFDPKGRDGWALDI